jgi:hypothetical protein
MRVFDPGASDAIGTRLLPQLIERRREVFGTHRSNGGAESFEPSRATSTCLTGTQSSRRWSSGGRKQSSTSDRARRSERLEALRPRLPSYEPAPLRGTERAHRNCTCGGCHVLRGPEYASAPCSCSVRWCALGRQRT